MDWMEEAELGQWLSDLLPKTRDVCLASPYITRSGVQALLAELHRRRRFGVTVLTCLDPIAAVTAALDTELLSELVGLTSEVHPVTIYHVPNLHAKVVALDERAAVVGSGNLTRSGTQGLNVELGVRVTARADVRALRAKMQGWHAGRLPLTMADLLRFQGLVRDNFGDVAHSLSDLGWGRLQVFPNADPARGYFEAMLQAIKTAGGRGCRKAQMLEALRNRTQGQAGSNTARTRLLFLESLGLIAVGTDGKLRATPHGVALSRKGGAHEFGLLLMDEYPKLKAAYLALCATSVPLTYPEIAAAVARDHPARSGIGPEEATAETEDGVRWLRDLGFVREADRRNQDGRKLFVMRPVQQRDFQ